MLPTPVEGQEATFDAATLIGESERLACQIIRFTAAGATLHLASETLAEGDAHILELRNGQTIPGTLSWLTDDTAGFVFDTPIDVVATLARNLALLSAERRRVPRVEIHQTVCVRRGNNMEFARTRDISQAGVGFDTEIALQIGEEVHLAFDGLRPITGTVRWVRGPAAGIAFDEELGWQTLMPWLRDVQTRRRTGLTARQPIHDEDQGFGLAADKQAIRLNSHGRVREGKLWWNVRIRTLTPTMVEFDAPSDFAKGTQLWLSLPGTAGWPIGVIEIEQGRTLAEFRQPLRPHELAGLAPGRVAIA